MDRGAALSAAAWSTDEELASAVKHFAEKIPGYVTPVAYGVARLDDGHLTFGELLEESNPASTFMAIYVTDLDDKPVGACDVAFRARLSQ
jgi:hypothetical protein